MTQPPMPCLQTGERQSPGGSLIFESPGGTLGGLQHLCLEKLREIRAEGARGRVLGGEGWRGAGECQLHPRTALEAAWVCPKG